MSTRQATPQDAVEVAGIHVRAWRVAYRGLVADPVLDGLRVADRQARYDFGDTGPGGPVTVVAVSGATIRGFVTVGPARDEPTPTGEVQALYVDPPAWGCGVGRALLA